MLIQDTLLLLLLIINPDNKGIGVVIINDTYNNQILLLNFHFLTFL